MPDITLFQLPELMQVCPAELSPNPYYCCAMVVLGVSHAPFNQTARIQYIVIRVLIGFGAGFGLIALGIRAWRGNLWFLRTLVVKDGKSGVSNKLYTPNAIPCFLVVMLIWCALTLAAATRAYQTEGGQVQLISVEVFITIASIFLWIAGWLQMCGLVFSVPRFIHSSASTASGASPNLWISKTTPHPFSLNRLPTWALMVVQILPPLCLLALTIPFTVIAVYKENRYMSINSKVSTALMELGQIYDDSGQQQVPGDLYQSTVETWSRALYYGTTGLDRTRTVFTLICVFDALFFLVYYRFTWAIARMIRQQIGILDRTIHRLARLPAGTAVGNETAEDNEQQQSQPPRLDRLPTSGTRRSSQVSLSTFQAQSKTAADSLPVWKEDNSPTEYKATKDESNYPVYLSWIPEEESPNSYPIAPNPPATGQVPGTETIAIATRNQLMSRRTNLRGDLYHILFLAAGIFLAFICDILATLWISFSLNWPNFTKFLLVVFWCWGVMSFSSLALLAWTGFKQPKASDRLSAEESGFQGRSNNNNKRPTREPSTRTTKTSATTVGEREEEEAEDDDPRAPPIVPHGFDRGKLRSQAMPVPEDSNRRGAGGAGGSGDMKWISSLPLSGNFPYPEPQTPSTMTGTPIRKEFDVVTLNRYS